MTFFLSESIFSLLDSYKTIIIRNKIFLSTTFIKRRKLKYTLIIFHTMISIFPYENSDSESVAWIKSQLGDFKCLDY